MFTREAMESMSMKGRFKIRPFELGGKYYTRGGKLVTIVEIDNRPHYQWVLGDDNICRYNRPNDYGRVTASSFKNDNCLMPIIEFDPVGIWPDHTTENIRAFDPLLYIQHMAEWLVEANRRAEHWEANHDNQVKLARLCKARDDLPLDRILGYDMVPICDETIASLDKLSQALNEFKASLHGDGGKHGRY